MARKMPHRHIEQLSVKVAVKAIAHGEELYLHAAVSVAPRQRIHNRLKLSRELVGNMLSGLHFAKRTVRSRLQCLVSSGLRLLRTA